MVLAALTVIGSDSVSQVHLDFSAACPDGFSLAFTQSKGFSVLFDGRSATSGSTTYSVGSYKSPHLHTADLCNLTPGKRYDCSVSSFQGSFIASPGPSDANTPTVLEVAGDFDFADDSLRGLTKPYQNMATQAILVARDWSYANGQHPQWDKWFDLQSPTFSTLPVTGINGNHETVIGDESYKAYLRRVPGPISEDSKAALRTCCSIEIGLVHITFLDDYRTEPIYKNKVDSTKGVVYVTTGAGGRGHAGSRISKVPNWSAFAEGDMQVLWFGNDDLNKPIDSFTIIPK
ncbi:hypothetical protein ACHHYP_16513 [Achlya hypogyna]|uniref:Purple acid phosphatase n=1 Tax=Achlya hypogyna TaxID=1202772 RepID=A0A1V9Y6G1_ACHHY|nr:hypothetical protein ACHHYP_16513 [Achlya hypogyna]